MKKLLATLLLLAAPAILMAQTVVVVLMLFGAAACGGMLIWVVDKNAAQISMRWVILERSNGHGNYTSVETNRVPLAPNKLEAFPAFFIVNLTNSIKLYRVRLAEDWEIPQGFVPAIRPDAEAQPVLYDTNKLNQQLNP